MFQLWSSEFSVILAPNLGPDGGHGGLRRGAPPVSHRLLSQNTCMVRQIFFAFIKLWDFSNPICWESHSESTTIFLFIKFHKLSNIFPPARLNYYYLYLTKFCIEFIWKLFPPSRYFSIFHLFGYFTPSWVYEEMQFLLSDEKIYY